MFPYPQFILFGDSITQFGEPDLLPPLRSAYARRLDVVNRGFSGYTASMGNVQHVPLDQYVMALESIIQHPDVAAHGTKVILIVQAPIDEWQLDPRVPGNPESGFSRTSANAKKYAAACRDVGKRLNLPVVDLWTIFVKVAGWGGEGQAVPGSKECPKSQMLGRLLVDGIHFTPEGYGVMHQELVKVIAEHLRDEVPEQLPFAFPPWEEVLKPPKKSSGNTSVY